MRAFIVALTIAAALMSGAPARAQSAPPPDALAAARELITVMKMTDQLKMMFPVMMQSLKPIITHSRPEVEKDYDALLPVMVEGALARSNELTDLMATVYARNFTAAELRDVTAFYRTATGQKLLERLPAVMQQAMTAGQQLAQLIVKDMQQRMIEELRKRGHNI